MVSHLRVFGANRAAFWREASAGINRLAYFVAADVAQIPVMLAIPVAYLSIYHTLTSPRSSFGDQYAVMLATVFCCTGMSYAISLLCSHKNGQMASVVLALVGSMVSGSSTSLDKLERDFGSFGKVLASLSYSRWMVHATIKLEANQYPEVLQPLVVSVEERMGYDVVGPRKFPVLQCLGYLVLIGVVSRVLAFALLVCTHRGEQR